MSLERFPVQLPRNAYNPQEVVRAGDTWRLLQDVAIHGSTLRGWPPERYRREGCAFVARSMTVLHHQSSPYGEALDAATWVSSFKRGLFSHREIRVTHQGAPRVSATQVWVHVAAPKLKVQRASDELQENFKVVQGSPSVALPDLPEALGPSHSFPVRVWHLWMDPLAHVNHPVYMDWVDEALATRMMAAGLDPAALRPVAERLEFRSAVVAPEQIRVITQRVAQRGEVQAVKVEIRGEDGRLAARGLLHRAGLGEALDG